MIIPSKPHQRNCTNISLFKQAHELEFLHFNLISLGILKNNLENQELDVVCYGIGDLIDSHIAQSQFACLSLIVESLNVRKPVKIYDPVMNLNHSAEVLNRFGHVLNSRYNGNFVWFEENDECCHPAHVLTLFYMPHCSLQMYLNVLRTNVEHNLSRTMIIGNSFQSYVERRDHNAIKTLIQYTLEHNFDNDVRNEKKSRQNPLYESFNDTSLHWFNVPTGEEWKEVTNLVLTSDNNDQYSSELITKNMLTNILLHKS
jgi:hypothetical protein